MNPASVVSREELGALLSSGYDEHARARGNLRPIGMVDTGRGELAAIASQFAAEQGRSLSTIHQTPIRFSFSHWEEISLRQFASAMLETDRIARIDLGAGGQDAYLLLGRPLIFGWMMLAFGSQSTAGTDLIPSRPYTRIEERFLRRAAEDVAGTFAKVLTGESEAKERVVTIETPTVLFDRSKRPHRVVSVDVGGLGEASCMRIALPLAVLEEAVTDANTTLSSSPDEIARQIVEVPVELHVEIGFADIPLRDLAQLSVNDELTLQRTAGNQLVVNVAGTPKFRAEPGKLGNRLAVRIMDEI